jgi:hypothetical protein
MTGIDTTWLVDLEVGNRDGMRAPVAFSSFGARRPANASSSTIMSSQNSSTWSRTPSVSPHPCHGQGRRTGVVLGIPGPGQARFPRWGFIQRSLMWMSAWGLGRKRIVDAQMAAAYAQAGVSRLLTAQSAGLRRLRLLRPSRVLSPLSGETARLFPRLCGRPADLKRV